MKYIRTKDGRIVELSDGCDISYAYQGLNGIKVGDTIEELCDMFVVWQEGFDMPVEMPLSQKNQFEKMKTVVSLGIKAGMNIWMKLAIWTDKGLIYVAKINEKGEFELLKEAAE